MSPQDVLAKNYESVSTFVKVMQQKLASFFPGHSVYYRVIGVVSAFVLV